MIVNNWYMSKQNQAIDTYIRRQRFRKVLVFVSVMVLFVGFMSYALYMEYGWSDLKAVGDEWESLAVSGFRGRYT